MDKFERDLDILMDKMEESSTPKVFEKLKVLHDRLIKLHEENMVKINHSVLELICARHLIRSGYKVNVECMLDGVSCDLYGEKGLGTLIVEVETGFIPPEHALDPLTYSRARITSKIVRYSGYAHKFCLGIPPHYIIQIPPTLTQPPRYRKKGEVNKIKDLCDLYYSHPPVKTDEIINARIHAIYILDVDSTQVYETDPETYTEKAACWNYESTNLKGENIRTRPLLA